MVRNKILLLVVLVIGLPFPLVSQTPVPETPRRPPQIAIRAARLLDVKDGRLINNAVVLIEGERIVAVGAGLSAPASATVIDLGDVTLLPGLIDCHTHLLASLDSNGDYGRMLLTKSQAYRALEGAANARKTLRAGFTAVRDVESEGSGYADVALRDAINRGLVEGPRMKVATRAIAAVGSYEPRGISPDLPDFPRGAQLISGVEEARRAAREQIGNGADHLKVYADWGCCPTLTPDELRVIVEEAHKARKRVAAHAQTVDGIRNALNAGVDSIEHGNRIDREMLEVMRQKGIWIVPTLSAVKRAAARVTDAEVLKRQNAMLENKQKILLAARDMGVKIALGYDAAEESLHGTNGSEIVALTEAGFSNLEAIRIATLGGAELLGWQDQIGSLEAGKFADIIAVRGNPLSDISQLKQVLFVMKGGAVKMNEVSGSVK